MGARGPRPPLLGTAALAALHRSAGFIYLAANIGGVRYQPLSTVRRIGGDRVLALGPGDALVATEKQLFIWWGHHGRWQALDANAWGARRDDWGRLRAWTKAVWPRHHLPDRAVIERPHGR